MVSEHSTEIASALEGATERPPLVKTLEPVADRRAHADHVHRVDGALED
jgi:hypothetical protein